VTSRVVGDLKIVMGIKLGMFRFLLDQKFWRRKRMEKKTSGLEVISITRYDKIILESNTENSHD